MDTFLKGKTVLITGSSRGIGKAIALRLAAQGARLVVNYARNEEAANQTAEEIRSLGSEVSLFQANVGDRAAAEALVEHAVSVFGGIDILIHNAAMGAFKPVHKLKANQWDLSFDINVKAFLFLVQKALPSMEARGGGDILALSSLGAHRFIPNYGAVGLSKAALENMIRYLAVELAPKKIRVNGVSGGLVDTDALKFFPDYEKFKQEAKERTPAGRIGTADDLARVVEFLVSPAAGWIVGQTLIADGGLSLI